MQVAQKRLEKKKTRILFHVKQKKRKIIVVIEHFEMTKITLKKKGKQLLRESEPTFERPWCTEPIKKKAHSTLLLSLSRVSHNLRCPPLSSSASAG